MVTDSLWIEDTGVGHALNPDKSWPTSLQKGASKYFQYGIGSTSVSELIGPIQFDVLNSAGKWQCGRLTGVALNRERLRHVA